LQCACGMGTPRRRGQPCIESRRTTMRRKKKNMRRTKGSDVHRTKDNTMANKKKEDSMNIQTTPEETVQTGTPAVDAPVTETPTVDATVTETPAGDTVTETPAGDTAVPPLGEILDLFHTSQQEGYATIGVNSHRETWALHSKEFRRLREQYYYAL